MSQRGFRTYFFFSLDAFITNVDRFFFTKKSMKLEFFFHYYLKIIYTQLVKENI